MLNFEIFLKDIPESADKVALLIPVYSVLFIVSEKACQGFFGHFGLSAAAGTSVLQLNVTHRILVPEGHV